MIAISKKEIRDFQKEILDWYFLHKRALPWRGNTDPYKILVSEVMSQQTQISRVVPKYEAWIQAFPTVEALAKAKTADVLKHWSGLGYNRRALYLQKCAREIVTSYSSSDPPAGGESRSKGSRQARAIHFPQTVEELKKLPGIGEYTASAIACFAFGQQIAVVDTNVRKVILKKFPIKHYELRIDEKKIQEIAKQLLPVGRAIDWNQALMDYASAMLKQEKIPIPKQSTFKGSDRYYRGHIVKLLLSHKRITLDTLYETLHIMLPLDKKRFLLIMEKLIKENIIKKEKDEVFFA